jgi:hypothetical protein
MGKQRVAQQTFPMTFTRHSKVFAIALLLPLASAAPLIQRASAQAQTPADEPAPARPPVLLSNGWAVKLPTSTIKQDGKAPAIKTTATKLTEVMTKPCRECRGDGKIRVRSNAPIAKPEYKKCPTCDGNGRMPNDQAKIDAAGIAVATSITRLAPDATGADIALQEAFNAITDIIVKNSTNYLAQQKNGTFALASTKPPVNQVVMCKAEMSGAVEHLLGTGKKIYLLKVPNKTITIGIVSPKHAEPPPPGGRAFVGGAIAGAIKVNGERIVLLERGFIMSPHLEDKWWAIDW